MEAHALVGDEQETNMAHEESGGAPGGTRAAERLATLPRKERRLLIAMAAATVTPSAVAMLSSRAAPEILVGLTLLVAAVALYGWCVTRRRPAAPAVLAVLTVLTVLAYAPPPAAWWLSVSVLPLFVLGRFVETACALRRTCPESVAEEVARSRMRTDRRLQELLHVKLAEIETRGARVRLLLDENDGSASAELAEVAALAKNTQQVLREFAHREFWAEPAGPDGDEHHR